MCVTTAVGKNDGELLTAITCGQVRRAGVCWEDGSDASQDVVSCLMAVAVTDFLEIVDIGHEKRQS
jgi:hypothetical protein